MTINYAVAEKLVNDLQPIVSKAILYSLVKEQKISTDVMFKTLVDFNVLKVVEKPKNKENYKK